MINLNQCIEKLLSKVHNDNYTDDYRIAELISKNETYLSRFIILMENDFSETI